MSSQSSGDSEFVFRKNDDIGAAGAEEDQQFLSECFIDTGELPALLDCANPKRIVIGRTGAGKTALLGEIENKAGKLVALSPHSLSLNYIANNDVIRFFEDAGVNLSPFYGLLWKHIIVVELLKARYDIRTEQSQKVCMGRLRELLSRDRIKEQAVDYLEKWGNKFWLTTEERMQELTSRIQDSLSASVGSDIPGLTMSAAGARELSSETKTKIIERGRKAVSQVQVRELENLISVLGDAVFTDRQKQFYISVDTLDEEWTDDRIRFRLIKALINAVRTFRKVENVKIIVALRQDLLEKVLHSTPDPGFQEEKYQSLYLYLRWTESQLKELVARRLNHLVKRRYTSRSIQPDELFPRTIDKKGALDYIVSRTSLRPRDAILFINECIALSDGKPALTAEIVKKAEEGYSHGRLQSLATEWQIMHPNLKLVAEMFYGMREHFPVSDLTREFMCERYEEAVQSIENPDSDPMTLSLNRLYTDDGNFGSVRNLIVRTLHFVGLMGIKVGATSSINWAQQSGHSLAPGQVRPASTVHFHPMYYRALGVRF